MRTLLNVAAALFYLHTTNVAAVELDSGAKQVALVELFSSEGCSSCPPADHWLSTLRDDTRLCQSVVPVAFRVDYWDYIGWPDRFAVPQHPIRQRTTHKACNMHSVCTPGFAVAGQEWHGWFRKPDLRLEQPPEVGRLQASATERELKAQFRPSAELGSRQLQLTFAVLGMGLKTAVRGGENASRDLSHDFVVMHTQRWPMQITDDGYAVMHKIRLPRTEARGRAVGVRTR